MIWIEISWRNLRRNPSRSIFAVLVACTGVTALLLALGYMLSAFDAVREGTIRGGMGHLQVAHHEEFGGYSDQPLQHGLDPKSLTRISNSIKPFEGEIVLLPRLEFQGVASSGDRSVVFLGEGVEPNEERRLSKNFIQITDGVGLERSEDIKFRGIIGQEMARLLGVQVGGMVTLLAPTVDSGLNAVDIEVVGLSASGNPMSDRTRVVVPLALGQSLLRTDKVSRVVLGLDASTNLEQVRSVLQPQLPELQVKSWSELAVFYHQLVELYSLQFVVFGFIILVVVVLTFSNTILMGVLERSREIGTLLALGIDRQIIRLLFVIEGLMLGAIGSVSGAVLAAALTFLINAGDLQMPPPPGQTLGYPLHFTYSFVAAAAITGCGMFVGMLSAFFASHRVSKSSPLQALNHA